MTSDPLPHKKTQRI